MRYLHPDDYSFQLRDDLEEIISDGNTERLPRAERAAAKLMISKLKKRYDTTSIFVVMREYDALAFATGERCFWRPDVNTPYKVYEALQATTGNLPTVATFWEEVNDRDELVMMYLGDIALYHYYAADAVRAYTDTVTVRWRSAMDWLRSVSEGEIEADLPQLPADEFTGNLRFGSATREHHSW